jgi:hypothetical protein
MRLDRSILKLAVLLSKLLLGDLRVRVAEKGVTTRA